MWWRLWVNKRIWPATACAVASCCLGLWWTLKKKETEHGILLSSSSSLSHNQSLTLIWSSNVWVKLNCNPKCIHVSVQEVKQMQYSRATWFVFLNLLSAKFQGFWGIVSLNNLVLKTKIIAENVESAIFSDHLDDCKLFFGGWWEGIGILLKDFASQND